MSTSATAITEEDQQICDETDCAEMYRKLPKKTSPGPDSISYEAFIHAGRDLIDLIDSTMRMFNTIWKTETIPEQWTKSYMKVIYKGKEAKEDLQNYRSIFLSNVSRKIFEKLVYKKLEPISQKYDTIPSRSEKRKMDNRSYTHTKVKNTL